MIMMSSSALKGRMIMGTPFGGGDDDDSGASVPDEAAPSVVAHRSGGCHRHIPSMEGQFLLLFLPVLKSTTTTATMMTMIGTRPLSSGLRLILPSPPASAVSSSRGRGCTHGCPQRFWSNPSCPTILRNGGSSIRRSE